MHIIPDSIAIKNNIAIEPKGERIRAELVDFLERNKIVSILLDTDKHTVNIQSVKLPSDIMSVLTKYGCIYISIMD